MHTGNRVLFAALLSIGLAAGSSRAQVPPGMPSPTGGMPGPGGAGGAGLISNPAVQADLKLTDQQKAQLQGIEISLMNQGRAAMTEAGNNGVDAETVMAHMNALHRERDAAVGKVLNPRQKARLAQIELRREGYLAAARTDVATKLKLSATQSRKIKSIAEQVHQAQAQAMPGSPGGFPQPDGGGFPQPDGVEVAPGGQPGVGGQEFQAQSAQARASVEKLQGSANQQIGAVLKPEQKEAFEKLLGEPFDMAAAAGGPVGTLAPPGTTPKAEPAPKAEATPTAEPAPKAGAKSKAMRKSGTAKRP